MSAHRRPSRPRVKRRLVVLATLLILPLVGLNLYTRFATQRAEARYPPVGQFVSIANENVHLHYVGKGTGQPVVLVHGNAGTVHDYLMGVFDLVAKNHHAIAFDRPGHGYSERPSGDAGSPLEQARLLHLALGELGIERPILVGHSWGGGLVLAYALEYPQDVAGIVLVQGTFYNDPKLINPLYPVLQTPIAGDVFASTVGSVLGRARVEQTLTTAFAPDAVPPDYLTLAQSLWTRPAQLKAIAEDALRRPVVLEELKHRYAEVRVPVVILAGAADALVDPAQQSFRLHDTIPHSRIVVLPDAGHQIPQTRPQAVLDAILLVAGKNDADEKAR